MPTRERITKNQSGHGKRVDYLTVDMQTWNLIEEVDQQKLRTEGRLFLKC